MVIINPLALPIYVVDASLRDLQRAQIVLTRDEGLH